MNWCRLDTCNADVKLYNVKSTAVFRSGIRYKYIYLAQSINIFVIRINSKFIITLTTWPFPEVEQQTNKFIKSSIPVIHRSLFSWRCQICENYFFSVALQSLKDLGRLTYRRFLKLFKHMVGLLGRVISPSKGLYLHRTRKHRKTRKNIHALSGIRTHDPNNQPAKTHASDRTATVTGCENYWVAEILIRFAFNYAYSHVDEYTKCTHLIIHPNSH
jgi:hypothetical protein